MCVILLLSVKLLLCVKCCIVWLFWRLSVQGGSSKKIKLLYSSVKGPRVSRGWPPGPIYLLVNQ
jgi:hypothetical protein